MGERLKNLALVSLDEWNAIHDELREAFSALEASTLTAEEFQAASQTIQSTPTD